jgi:hypothetical protein
MWCYQKGIKSKLWPSYFLNDNFSVPKYFKNSIVEQIFFVHFLVQDGREKVIKLNSASGEKILVDNELCYQNSRYWFVRVLYAGKSSSKVFFHL